MSILYMSLVKYYFTSFITVIVAKKKLPIAGEPFSIQHLQGSKQTTN